MGAILAGIVHGVGKYQQEQNTIGLAAQQKANEDMAQFLESSVANNPDPSVQTQMHVLAARYRSLGAKKPTKDMDLHQLFTQANTQQYQQKLDQAKTQGSQQNQQKQQAIAQAQPIVQRGVTGPAGVGASGPAGITPLVPPDQNPLTGGGGLPAPVSPNPSSAAGPSPAAAAEQGEAASPSPNGGPTGGLPSPGMNSVAPPIAEEHLPYGVFRTREGALRQGPFGTPMQQAQFGARVKGMQAGAEAQAKLPAEISLAQAQRQAEAAGKITEFREKYRLAQQMINDMRKQDPDSAEHWTIRVGFNGPEMTQDQGTPLPRVYIGSQLPPRAKIEGGEAADPQGTYTLIRYKDGTLAATPVATPQATGQTTAGNLTQFSRYVPGSAEAVGAVAPSLAAPKPITDKQGNVSYESVGQMVAGAPPVASGGINPSMAPTTSTQTIPGQLPQTTTRVRGIPAPAPAKPPTRSSVNAIQGDNSVIANNYKDWIAGKATLSDKEQTAARQYAASRGLPTPEILSAGGQKAIATIQPILEEVQRAKKMIEDMGLDKMGAVESKAALAKAYGKYAYLKTDDPLAKVISDLSFDSLRSVGQALQGTGSRAYPIFNRALEHTPVIGLNSDDGALIHSKLTEMETRLKASLDAAYTETKSGIVPQGGISAPGVTPPSRGMVNMRAPDGTTRPVPAAQVEHYKSLGAHVVQ